MEEDTKKAALREKFGERSKVKCKDAEKWSGAVKSESET